MKSWQKNALETALKAAHAAGVILMQGFGKMDKSRAGIKGMGDYVTEMDHDSEETVIRIIRESFPSHSIQAEESGEEIRDSSFRWLIDPLDGTANYVQGIPVFCVSIGLLHEGREEIGIVYDPSRDEMFRAARGGGAYLNNVPFRIAQQTELSQCMLATGFPWRLKSELETYLESFRRLFLISAGIRRLGSAALDLAYTACGRFDGFWEMRLNPWDIAAGSLLVQEAGGIVSDFDGSARYLCSGNVVAGNKNVHDILCGVLHKV